MEWTTDEPTKPGIYWAAKPSRTIPASGEWDVDVVKIEWAYPPEGYGALGWPTPEDNRLEYSALGDEGFYNLDYYTHWQGPIEKPMPPRTTL
jgi:hypothetical protein